MLAAVISVALGAVFSAHTWLRFFFISSVRLYEAKRWHNGRELVEDSYNSTQHEVHNALGKLPGFSGKLMTHFADPPYNQRPLVFGVEFSEVRTTGVRFVEALPEDSSKINEDRSGENKAAEEKGDWYFLSEED